MNLDQQTTEQPKTQEELRDEIAQLQLTLGEQIQKQRKDEAEFGQAALDTNQYVADLKEIIQKKQSELQVFKAEEIVENKFNNSESMSDAEQQTEYHDKLLQRAEALYTEYTTKKEEAENNLKNMTAGTPEYVVTANLIAQYEKQIASSQMSIDSNKAAKKRLEQIA